MKTFKDLKFTPHKIGVGTHAKCILTMDMECLLCAESCSILMELILMRLRYYTTVI